MLESMSEAEDDNPTHDRVMTAKEFKLLRREICPKLRFTNDPPPRTMRPGTGDSRTPCRNIRELLEKHADTGAKVVRGFRMLTNPVGEVEWEGMDRGNIWKAVFHLVVAHPPKDSSVSSKWIYECATTTESPEDQHSEFIFVPSSRAHSELNDEQVLSGEWLLGVVVGGNPICLQAIFKDNQTRGRERSLIAETPERCIAKRSITFRIFPHFKSWFDDRKRKMTLEATAEFFGFPIIDAATKRNHPEVDYFKGQNLIEALDLNTNKLVDGGRQSVLL